MTESYKVGSPQVIIFTECISPRLSYIFKIFFEVLYPVSYVITHSKTAYCMFDGIRINYSSSSFGSKITEVKICPDGLLTEDYVKRIDPALCSTKKFGLGIFPSEHPEFFDLPFDVFSASFYLISRYEEYLPIKRDVFGRVSGKDSWQYRHGVLEYPLVDQWAKQLIELLQERWPLIKLPQRTYRYMATYDIDVAWAYLHRPIWRHVLSMLRDIAYLNWPNLRKRISVWEGKDSDPYSYYDYLMALSEHYQLDSHFFFLVSNYAQHEPAISHRHPAFQSLVKKMAGHATIGLHPSLASRRIVGRLEVEKKRLEAILGREVVYSRQHFLMVHLPETYHRLIASGIHKDFSMGYSDVPGFRAGISSSFPWFDLHANQETPLWIQPIHVMDVTLKQYLRLNPVEAVDRTVELASRCKAVGGIFCTLWHNSSFNTLEGWEGWEDAYRQIVDLCV